MNDRGTSDYICADPVPITENGWVPWHPELGFDWIAIYYANKPPCELLGKWQWKRVVVTVQGCADPVP